MRNFWLDNNKNKVAVWDFNTVLGETIKEKYESLYVKVIEVYNVINRKPYYIDKSVLITFEDGSFTKADMPELLGGEGIIIVPKSKYIE